MGSSIAADREIVNTPFCDVDPPALRASIGCPPRCRDVIFAFHSVSGEFGWHIESQTAYTRKVLL